MDESVRKRSRLDQIRDFCTDTSAHGLGRVAAAKSWPGRVFWIAIVISASVTAIHQISLSFTTYFSYPTKTDYFIVIKEQLRFPAVTVCNINPFKQSEIKKTSFWRNMASISLCNYLYNHNFCITILQYVSYSYRTLVYFQIINY